MNSTITTPGYIIAQQETVQGKSRRVNHVKNVELRSRRNPEDRPIRQSNQNVQIVGERTLKITSFRQILWAPNHDSHTNIKRIRKYKEQIIATSNKSANLRHRSLLRRTNRKNSSKYQHYVERIDGPQAQIIATSN